jgi:hypothetical protein
MQARPGTLPWSIAGAPMTFPHEHSLDDLEASPFHIGRRLVPPVAWMMFLPNWLGIRHVQRGECLVYDWMGWLVPDYSGGYWDYHVLEGGGAYMALREVGHVQIVQSMNQVEEQISTDGASLCACLFALGQLAVETHSEHIGLQYHHLHAYVGQHAEAALILRIID